MVENHFRRRNGLTSRSVGRTIFLTILGLSGLFRLFRLVVILHGGFFDGLTLFCKERKGSETYQHRSGCLLILLGYSLLGVLRQLFRGRSLSLLLHDNQNERGCKNRTFSFPFSLRPGRFLQNERCYQTGLFRNGLVVLGVVLLYFLRISPTQLSKRSTISLEHGLESSFFCSFFCLELGLLGEF